MNEQVNLEDVIEEAVTDSVSPDPVEDVSTDDSVEAVEATSEVTDDISTEQLSAEVPSPAAATAQDPAAAVADEFAKRHGLQPQSVTGRENRIPYSRVKKIVGKVEQQLDTVQKQFAELQPKFQEYETKVKDYEERLNKVAQFENILENDPQTFLQMLSEAPAYKGFFDYVSELARGAQAQAPTPAQPTIDHSDMPQPDVALADGSKVYSLEGLAQRDEWLARKIEERAIQQAEARVAKRYAPIEQAWQAEQAKAQMIPVLQRQIDEARTWDKFNELEPRVIELLKENPRVDLKGAYMKAYQEAVANERERLTVDRNKLRSEILAEIKSKPVASSVPVSSVRPGSDTHSGGPRDLESIIAEEVRRAGLK